MYHKRKKLNFLKLDFVMLLAKFLDQMNRLNVYWIDQQQRIESRTALVMLYFFNLENSHLRKDFLFFQSNFPINCKFLTSMKKWAIAGEKTGANFKGHIKIPMGRFFEKNVHFQVYFYTTKNQLILNSKCCVSGTQLIYQCLTNNIPPQLTQTQK